MNGTVGILSVGAGDTKLVFDPNKPAEMERAKRIVTDMLKRGYALLIQIGEQDGEPIYRRAHAFDEKTCEYIIAGDPRESEQPQEAPAAAEEPAEERKPRKVRETRVRADSSRAVAVGRTAGG